MARSALMTVMIQAVRKAGRNLARDYGEVENLQVSMKGPGNFVSAADRKTEKTMIEELQRVRPGWGILTEESGEIEGSDPSHRWILDPIDGTTNFLHGIPYFGISLALERAGQIVAGVIYNPATDELFSVEKGTGAFLNDRRMRVAARRALADSVIGCAQPNIGYGDHAGHAAQLRQVAANSAGIRCFGASALDLAYVAAGRLDGLWVQGLKPWDCAAGVLMIREAGGFATDFAGRDKAVETGEIVAGNEDIHGALMKLLGGK